MERLTLPGVPNHGPEAPLGSCTAMIPKGIPSFVGSVEAGIAIKVTPLPAGLAIVPAVPIVTLPPPDRELLLT